jgi:hypothetical protein
MGRGESGEGGVDAMRKVLNTHACESSRGVSLSHRIFTLDQLTNRLAGRRVLSTRTLLRRARASSEQREEGFRFIDRRCSQHSTSPLSCPFMQNTKSETLVRRVMNIHSCMMPSLNFFLGHFFVLLCPRGVQEVCEHESLVGWFMDSGGMFNYNVVNYTGYE